MNIISTIGKYIKDGLTHAEVVVKLDVEHGVQVSEMWLKKIVGADGFTAVLDQVELATGLEGVATPAAPTTAEHQAAIAGQDLTVDRTTLPGAPVTPYVAPVVETPADPAGLTNI